ncbi:MAG: excinuclease ABC subunit UvrA [Chlorobi bacterium]|nr:excinuclease ABC subunit UvrA [Chlorobiota bacterium]
MSRKPTHIEIKGAREHNLKNIDVRIPLRRITVLTGISGSGKSGLAFNTLYAEGQRRFLETVSAYARQFVGAMERPDVDKIDHLPPVVAIEQKTVHKNPRSTVGTVTEIYDFLRLLYAKISRTGEDNTPVSERNCTPADIAREISEAHGGEVRYILAPMVRARKGHYRELFERLAKKRLTRVRVDGMLKDITPGMQVERYKTHDIEAVVDHLVVPSKEEDKGFARLVSAVETALGLGKGILAVWDGEGELAYYGRQIVDTGTGTALPEPDPNFFSFNSPKGYCPVCKGLGEVYEADLSKIIPDPSKSIAQGGLAPVDPATHKWITSQLEMIGKKYGFDLKTPIEKIPEEGLNKILYGTDEFLTVHSDVTGVTQEYRLKFDGLIPFIEAQFRQDESKKLRRWASAYMTRKACPSCGGSRLRPETVHFKIAGKHIGELTEMEIKDLDRWFADLPSHLDERQRRIGEEVIKEIRKRLSFLRDVGLDYLTLNRAAGTLSGGESQRIRLASQIGARLVNVLYILDEPSIGLHPSDNSRLIDSLRRLRDGGNTVVVVEHDKEMMRRADHIIDLGPGAGVQGGRIVAQGSPEEVARADSLTGAYLSGRLEIPVPSTRRTGSGKKIVLEGARGRNLKHVRLEIPLGKFIVVTGVSGSGKSTLINETLYPALRRILHGSLDDPLPFDRLEGVEHIDKVIDIDQSPIGRTPRSNPATYIGVFDDIRRLFAQTVEAKIRGYKPGRFSFNVAGGRCEVCQGAGVRVIEMNFLPDIHVTCEACGGKRFNRETLEVVYKNKNIHDVLEMSVSEALKFFEAVPRIKRKLQILEEIGLGYLKLGQPSTTLSGGEAQRVKLAAELAKRDTGKTLYILDEPTTGLHFEDIRLLADILNRLTDKGNTVLVIEHNTDIMKLADHIIDLGPGGGEAGGRILFEGTPEEMIGLENNQTARYLREELKNPAVAEKHKD